MKPLKIQPFGDRSILMEWEEKIDPIQHDYIIACKQFITQEFKLQIAETIIAYHSLLLILTDISQLDKLLVELENLDYTEVEKIKIEQNIWQIPTCYDSMFGEDLEFVASTSKFTKEEVVQIHSLQNYRIYFMGFLPGFVYLGGLDNRIACPRKPTPRISVPKGSVGIAGNQTGIYPQNSPGGWQIIGKTPVKLFDLNSSVPSHFKPGDIIQFNPISLAEFFDLEAKQLESSTSILDSL